MWGRSGNGILDIYPTGSAVYSILNLHNTAGGTAYNAQLIATSGQSVYLGSGNTGDVVLRTGNSQNKVVGRHNGATELYHSSTKKFETESNGASVDGRLRVRDSGDVSFTISDTSSNAVSGFMQVKTAGRLEYNCYKSGVGTKYPHVFVGYTEEYARIDTNGIKFNGDTAAANALDDYEEGSWTPALTGGYYSGETYTTQSGTYVKIGNLVTAWFYIKFNQMSTSGGEFRINSPFTMLTGTNHKGSGIISFEDLSNASSSNTFAVYQRNSTEMKFFAGNTALSCTAHTVQNNKFFIGYFTVRTP